MVGVREYAGATITDGGKRGWGWGWASPCHPTTLVALTHAPCTSQSMTAHCTTTHVTVPSIVCHVCVVGLTTEGYAGCARVYVSGGTVLGLCVCVWGVHVGTRGL